MTDRIGIEGLRVFAHHGVSRTEQERGQWFVVDVEAQVDLTEAGSSDALDATVDYGALAREVRHIVATERFALLEALAEHIAKAVLARPRVRLTRVRVAKPMPPMDVDLKSVWVEIERAR
ncbi:MAG: dihydroneopterin aldolase [Actinomycetota bacterium]